MVHFSKSAFRLSPLPMALLLVVGCLTGCAQKVAPDGGPRDSEPAEVLSTEPATGQRNMSETSMTIEFSDYVNQNIRSAISIQPATRFSTSYSGNSIGIEFLEELEPNTTYAVTLGTNWTDLAGNKPVKANSIIFSTGPDIDSGVIAGRVYGSRLDKVYIVAYPRADTLTSEFSPARDFPPYSIPVGASGEFSIMGLRDGLYRVIAVDDKNGNGLLDAAESYAMSHNDVLVAEGLSRENLFLLGKSIAQMRTDSIKLSDTVGAEDTTLVSDSVVVPDSADSLVPEKKKPLEPGSIEGTFRDSMNIGGPYLARFLNNNGDVVATIPVTAGEGWQVDSIPPGTYAVDIVVDENNNGAYDHGRPSPFTFSERWFPLKTTVVVRQRWTTEGIELVLR